MTLSLRKRGPVVARHRKPNVTSVTVFEQKRRGAFEPVYKPKSELDFKLGLMRVIADEAKTLRDCLAVCKRISNGIDDERSWDALDITADGAEPVRVRLA